MIDVEMRSRIKMTPKKIDALQRKHYEIQEIRVLETRKNLEKKHHVGYQNQKKSKQPKKGWIEGRSITKTATTTDERKSNEKGEQRKKRKKKQ